MFKSTVRWASRPSLHFVGIVPSILAALAVAGCQSTNPDNVGQSSASDTAQAASVAGDILARGVVHYGFPTGANSGIDIIDVDLANTSARIAVGARGIREDQGAVVADALTPTDWVNKGALAAVNGGYFGDDHGDSKEIVGLLVENGRVRHAAPALTGSGAAGLAPGYYTRSVFGVMASGIPQIVWAASEVGRPQNVRAYPSPTPPSLDSGRPWNPKAAIGCGPTLIHNGRAIVSDRLERLVSEGDLPRTFVAYDRVHGRPRHVAIGVTNSATFEELTSQIQDFFVRYDHTRAWAAMCFDGGPSTQMTYRVGDTLHKPLETQVGLSDCLLVLPGRR